MNHQLDFWDSEVDISMQNDMYPFTWEKTLMPAMSSYLMPWFIALKQSMLYSHESKTRRFSTQAMYDAYRIFGLVAGHKFEYWWQRHGHRRLGWTFCLPGVQVTCKKHRGKPISPVVSFEVQESKEEVIQRLAVLIALRARMRSGFLSQCPECWPWFDCGGITPQRMCRYLEVFRVVALHPEHEHGRFLHAGSELELCPKAHVHAGDSRREIQSKRDAIVKTTYAYWGNRPNKA
jgi:hypothetical protein